MNSFDELDNIFNDVVEEISTQEVTVESDKTWMFYISMSYSYTRRDLHPYDDITLRANWTANEYQITYYMGNENGTTSLENIFSF